MSANISTMHEAENNRTPKWNNFTGSGQEQFRTWLCNSGFHWSIHGPLIVVFLCIFVANSTVVVLMLWKETLRTQSNLFLGSLAVSDLVFGLIGIPCFLSCTARRSIKICLLSTLVVRFTAISSMFHLLLIAGDRYIMIVHSLKYNTLITKRRVLLATVSVWLLSLISTIIRMSWFNREENASEVQEKEKIYFIFIIAFFFAPLLLIIYMYSYIFEISLGHILAVRRLRRNLDQPCLPIAHDLRGTFILVLMMLIFVCCWLPFFLMMFQDHVKAKVFSITEWGLCIILYLRFIPPLSNPILWAFCKQDFRRVLCRLTSYKRWPIRVHFRSAQSYFSPSERNETASTLNETTRKD